MLTMTTAVASPARTRPRRSPSTASPAALRRLGLPLGFPLPPLTVPRSLSSPPMTPVPEQTPLQTKEVEYYRAAPSAPGTHSVDLERVHPVVRPTRSPSDPPAVAPLSIGKRVRSPPAAIMVPSSSTRLEIVRLQRSPARQTGHFDADAPPSSSHVSAETHAPPSSYLAPRSQSNRGPAPGPPPQGPLPPLPDQEPPFSAVDPLVLRAVSARERRETRRQSKTPDDKDKEIAALERSMRRLSRISLVTGSTSPAGDTSGPTSPTISLAGSLSRGESQVGRLERTEKLLRRISRQSDGVRLPSDYGRVGISGYSVPASAPVSPGIRGVSSPLRPHKSETEASELAYLVDERPSPALSVPMRRNVDHRSAHAAYTPAISEPIHGLGLGLTLTPSDSMSSSMASTSMSSLPSTTSMSTLPSESTIRPTLETRSSRLGSLSSASSTAASIHSAQTFETASTTSLLTPVSPPTQTTPLPKPSRSPMSPPRQLKLKATIRLPSPAPLPSRPASPDVPSILAQFRETPTLPVPSPEVSAVPATRIRPGARPRVHSDLAPLDIPPPVPPKDGAPEHAESNRSSTDSRVAVEDSPADIYRANEDSNVLEVPPMRQSLESQATPRVAHVSRSSAPTPTPKAAQNPSRPASPDIPYLLRNTPRPVRRGSQHSLASSLAGSHRTVGTTAAAPPSSFRPTPGLAGPSRRGSEMSIASSRRSSSAVTASSAGFDVQGAGPEYFFGEQYDSEDSDSDLDLSTPLPHMMLRAGLLSPRSTIITELVEPAQPAPSGSGLSARGEALRLKGEKVWKAESKRKIRHRDGRNLRDGVGLTTGLGWSDSEDEDAPSPLRRRLSSVLLAKAQAQSRPPSQLSRQTPLTLSRRSTYSNLDSTSVSSQSLPRTPASHPLSLPLTPSSLPGAASGADEFGKLDFPLPPTATSRRPLPSPGLKRIPSSTMMRSASNPAPPAVPPTPSSLRTRTTSNVSSTTSAGGLRTPARSKMPMPVPTPRQSKVNMRSPSGTRLSAPEALRQTDRVVTDGSRRLSGA